MERNMAADNTANDIQRVWDLMKKIGFAMLVTRDGDKLRARPMSAYLDRDENAILFLTDARRHKDDAEFWDSPGSVISYVKMAAAAVTGTRPDLSDNRKVAM
jgi:Pyridoxamine 5'-phosphate oxidase like